MIDNPGFWLWLLLMLFISSVIGGLGIVVWRSERQGNYLPDRSSEGGEAGARRKDENSKE